MLLGWLENSSGQVTLQLPQNDLKTTLLYWTRVSSQRASTSGVLSFTALWKWKPKWTSHWGDMLSSRVNVSPTPSTKALPPQARVRSSLGNMFYSRTTERWRRRNITATPQRSDIYSFIQVTRGWKRSTWSEALMSKQGNFTGGSEQAQPEIAVSPKAEGTVDWLWPHKKTSWWELF